MVNRYTSEREKFVSDAQEELAEFIKNTDLIFGEWTYIIDFFKLFFQKQFEYYDKYTYSARDIKLLKDLEKIVQLCDELKKHEEDMNDEKLKHTTNELFSLIGETIRLLWD